MTPKNLFYASCCSLVVLCAMSCEPEPRAEPMAAGEASVVTVIDGDTVILRFDSVENGSVEETVRLLGIDTPETVHPDLPVQCYGPEASAALTELLPADTAVRAERDVEARDRYGRLLLYLYRASDDLFVNRWLVANGFADTSFYEPNTAYETTLSQARRQARSDDLGLWSHCEGPGQPLD